MFVIRNKNIFIAFSLGLLVLATAATIINGLNFGVDFTGGSVIEARFDERPSRDAVENAVSSVIGDAAFSVQEVEENGYLIRSGYLEGETQGELAEVIEGEALGGSVERVSAVGPSVGSELRQKSYVAIGIVLVAIVLFIAYAFRKVSEPVSSWVYGLVALVSLVHDVLIPIGVFAVFGFTVDILFVTALLAILGYSINDTIVVFDRVRENLLLNKEKGVKESFDDTIGESLEATFTRSINTSLTTLIAILAVYFFGGESTREFVLALAVGIAAGTYSSIFLASPVLLSIQRWQEKRAVSR